MKKILVLILAAILMIALTACGAKETEEENSGEGSLNPWHIYRIGVYFTGCSCQTVWTYEWRNIAG